MRVIFLVILLILIGLNFIFYTFYSLQVSHKEEVELTLRERYEERLKNSVLLLSEVYDVKTGKDYAFLLSYISMTGNEIYCLNDRTCINVSKLLTNYFSEIFGNRWNLKIYTVPAGLKGWIIKMFVVTGNQGDYDVCSYNPPNDNKGRNWWEFDYNDSFFVKNWNIVTKGRHIRGAGWVLVSAPFHEYPSPPAYGLGDLYNNRRNPDTIKQGICIPIYEILPEYTTTNASVYCPNNKWDLFNFFGTSSNTLPKLYDFGRHYINPPIYKTATDITALAKELGIIGSYSAVVGSFYRGEVIIPEECKEVYLDAPWHEVIRLYIAYINKTRQPDYVWLIAAPQCSNYNQDPKGKKGPIIKDSRGQGVVRFNITKWVILNRDPNNNTIVIANAYWDPHPGSNGVSMVRVYCITEDGKKLELNEYFYRQFVKEKIIELGYKIPKNLPKYVHEIWLPVQHPYIKIWYVGILAIW